MVILVKYSGEIKVNQLGINYSFPHYSTILGSVLSAYHKQVNTPRHPRIDMFELASQLDLELLLLVPTVNNNFLSIEYSQLRNLENKIKADGNVYSPSNKFISKGEFYFLIKTSNESIVKALTTFPLIFGSNDSTVIDYGLEFFSDFSSFLDKYNNKLYFLSSLGDYSLEARFSNNNLEVCLVSQIQNNQSKIFCQGIYSSCEWRELDSDFDVNFINYTDLFKDHKSEVVSYVNKINGES